MISLNPSAIRAAVIVPASGRRFDVHFKHRDDRATAELEFVVETSSLGIIVENRPQS
jgi:hypothetical protein